MGHLVPARVMENAYPKSQLPLLDIAHIQHVSCLSNWKHWTLTRHPTVQPSYQCICPFCTWHKYRWHIIFDQQMCDTFMRAYGSSSVICVWLCYVHWEETVVSKRKAIKQVQLKSRICYELLYIQFQTSLWSPSYFIKSELNHYKSTSGKANKWICHYFWKYLYFGNIQR